VPFVNALKGYGVHADVIGLGPRRRLPGRYEQRLAAPVRAAARGRSAAHRRHVHRAIDLGIRDVSHLVQYAEHLGQVLAPRTFPQFAAGLQAIKARTEVDVDRDFIGQLGDAVIATDAHLFAVRVKAKTPPSSPPPSGSSAP